MNYDVLVVGSGPAGLAAAVAARGRDKSVLVAVSYTHLTLPTIPPV